MTVTQVEPTRSVPFGQAGCLCVKDHSPVPKNVDLHHVYPQGEQKKRHGRVLDHETVPLCRNAHDAVHVALNHMLAGRSGWGGNPYIHSVAREGLGRIMQENSEGETNA